MQLLIARKLKDMLFTSKTFQQQKQYIKEAREGENQFVSVYSVFTHLLIFHNLFDLLEREIIRETWRDMT